MDKNSRKAYIDRAKGIGILMVIYGHCVTGENVFVAWQCSFFMPLFFLCSGLCYSTPKSLGQNARKILIPYYFWGAIGGVISLGFAVLRDTVGLDQLKDLGSYLAGMSMWNYPLWFLVAFFVCKCVFDGIMALSVNKEYIRVAIAIGAFVFGLCLAFVRHKYNFFFPFRADIGLVMVPFMLIGFYSKQIVERVAGMAIYKKLIITGALLAVNVLCVCCNTLVSVNSSDYGNPVAFVVGAVSGSYFVVIFCQVINKVPLLRQAIAWLGKNSLTIMCTHAIVLMLVAKVILVMNSFVGLDAAILDVAKFACCTLVMIPVCWLVNATKRIQMRNKVTKECLK